MEALVIILGTILFLYFEWPVIFWLLVISLPAIFIFMIFSGAKANKKGISTFFTVHTTDDSSESSHHHKTHSGRCDGDCANCPPHYGYRHGRWYYGHDHIEGCVFGGNRGGGGM